MTVTYWQTKRGLGKRALSLLLLALLLLFLLFSPLVAQEIERSLSLCARVIVPTLFPFIVLSELLSRTLASGGTHARRGQTKKNGVCEHLFGVPTVGMSAFLLGALCGFPIGVKHARGLYDAGAIGNEGLARLLMFVNNTGPAFVIAGVGGALFGSVPLGICLYLIQVASALLVGVIFARIPCTEIRVQRRNEGAGSIHLAAAIGKSTLNILSVCGTVVFFSALCSLFSVFCKNSDLLQFIYPFFEVSGACNLAAACYVRGGFLSVLSAMLAISFGGAAVHMQALLFFEDGDFPLGRYLLAKLLQAALSCLLLVVFFPLVK